MGSIPEGFVSSLYPCGCFDVNYGKQFRTFFSRRHKYNLIEMWVL